MFLDQLQHFHFLRPMWALAFLPYFAMWWLMRSRENQGDMFDGIIAPHLLEHLRVNRFRSSWFNPQSFTSVMLALILIIMMGPTWRQQPSPLSQDDAATIILLDVSASMTQRDIQPSRLQRAKQKIADLLALRPDKRAALIVYSGSAHTVLSLTNDQAILQQYLAAIGPGIMPRAGKFPENALPEVDEILRQSTAPATLVLMADGASADSERVFKSYCESNQHQLVIMGIGTTSDIEGLIPLEEKGLKDLASVCNGSYVEMTVNDRDVTRINRKVDNHFVILEDSALPWLDSGYWLVFPTMALFLMWFRKGWTLTWSGLLLATLLGPAPPLAIAQGIEESLETEAASEQGHWFVDLWLTRDQHGHLLMRRGYYRQAAQRFESPMWKAIAYYHAEDFMVAAEYFSRSKGDAALFNEANARAHGRDYVRARNRYDRLLARNPDYPGATKNRARVQELIDEINRLSESQQEEAGVSSEEREMGGDEAIPADGAEQISYEESQMVQLSAEEILQNPETSAMWLRSVQNDPADFLANKFNMQLQNAEAENGAQQP